MKKLCGYDVNGWRDAATRNWLANPGGCDNPEEDGARIPKDSVDASKTVEGGILPSVVLAGDNGSGRWIGGIPASLAPHGHGAGWGDVGEPGKRISVRRCLSDGATDAPIEWRRTTQKALTAAFTGVSPGAGCGVAAIDDLPTTTELLQERILGALKNAGVSTPLLTWRPALAALHQIEREEAAENLSIGVICHAGPGFSVQTLRVRRGSDHNSEVLAPERKAAATLVRSGLGYEGLVRAARNMLGDEDGPTGEDCTAPAAAVGRLAFGEPVKPEISRDGSGRWRVLDPPASMALPKRRLEAPLPPGFGDADIILFETLTSGDVRRELHQIVSDAVDRTVVPLPANAIATAAFLAARRLSERKPVCFDFLPRISTLVHSSRHGVVNFDLIDENETLPAGEIYHSPEPARLHAPADRKGLSIYLRKENAEWPRKATVEIGIPFETATPVELSVEQSPAAGRAKLYLRSSSPVRQFTVDWDVSDEIEKSWDDLIEDLRAESKPSVPGRLVLPNHMEPWNWLSKKLEADIHKPLPFSIQGGEPDWKQLATSLAQPVSKPMQSTAEGAQPPPQSLPVFNVSHYCISSDGKVPEGVPRKTVDRLDELTGRAFKEVEARVQSPGQKKDADNSSLKFLTWQFRRCPAPISKWLLDAVCADQAGTPHPLITKSTDRVLVYQGLGRTAQCIYIERKAIQALLKKPADEWGDRCEMACAAFLLSRSANVTRLLKCSEVASLADHAFRYFDKAHNTMRYTDLRYALSLLVGLLRWRTKKPYSLVSDRDPLATRMAGWVKAASNDIKGLLDDKNTAKPVYGRYLGLLDNVLEELQGKGKNPDILLQIYGEKQ